MQGIARYQQPFVREVIGDVAGRVARRVGDVHRSGERIEADAVDEFDVDVDCREALGVVVDLDGVFAAVDVGCTLTVGEHDGIGSLHDVREPARVVGVLVGERDAPHVVPVEPRLVEVVVELVDRPRIPGVDQQQSTVGLDRRGVERELVGLDIGLVDLERQRERVHAVDDVHRRSLEPSPLNRGSAPVLDHTRVPSPASDREPFCGRPPYRADMGIGDVTTVTAGDCTDLYYVDTGMYDVEGYGAVYILDAERPALVDTGIGTNYERLLAAVEEVGLEPADIEVIAVTHVHLDHAGGAGFLVDECPNATVYVHESGARHLLDPGRLWAGTKQAVGDQIRFYTEPEPVPEDRLVEITDGDRIDLGDHPLDVHYAPGHAPHQVVFADPENDAVFAADAAGIYVPGRDQLFPTSPPPNFDPEQCQADIDLLRDLDPEVLCYTHFGPAERGDRLDEYADLLAAWVDAVAGARAELDDDEAVIEQFVAEADAEREAWGVEKADAEVAMNVRGVLTALDREA